MLQVSRSSERDRIAGWQKSAPINMRVLYGLLNGFYTAFPKETNEPCPRCQMFCISPSVFQASALSTNLKCIICSWMFCFFPKQIGHSCCLDSRKEECASTHTLTHTSSWKQSHTRAMTYMQTITHPYTQTHDALTRIQKHADTQV